MKPYADSADSAREYQRICDSIQVKILLERSPGKRRQLEAELASYQRICALFKGWAAQEAAQATDSILQDEQEAIDAQRVYGRA